MHCFMAGVGSCKYLKMMTWTHHDIYSVFLFSYQNWTHIAHDLCIYVIFFYFLPTFVEKFKNF